MTECERIISQGILPPEFFRPEIRNDFYVSETRKKIWAVELDMLLEFDRVCRKHKLKYFLASGTLLGAVRHRGFIPWDDDIDVYMMRDGYEKFMNLSGEFKAPYFLQTPYTDPGYFFSFAKIRNTNTSMLNGTFLFQGFNQGICIDIFPLDNVMHEDYVSNYEIIKQLLLENSTYMRLTNPYLKNDERVRSYRGGNPLERYEKIQATAMKHRYEKTEYVSEAVVTIYRSEKNIFHAEDFASSCEGELEGLSFNIPEGYDRILRIRFKDYMSFPPVKERGTCHRNLIFNPDVPYEKILKKYQSEAWPE